MIIKFKTFVRSFAFLLSCSQYELKNDTSSKPAKHKGQIFVPLPPHLDDRAILD